MSRLLKISLLWLLALPLNTGLLASDAYSRLSCYQLMSLMARLREQGDPLVSGAGPVGTNLAIQLADSGFHPVVIDKRPDPRVIGNNSGRSFNITLSERGLAAIPQDIRSAVLTHATPLRGRQFHMRDGSIVTQTYGSQTDHVTYAIARGDLSRSLISAAEYRGVKFVFGGEIFDVDLQNSMLSMRLPSWETGQSASFASPPLIGADGADSIIRRALSQVNRSQESLTELDVRYKAVRIPSAAAGNPIFDLSVLHMWSRQDRIIFGIPNADRSLSLILVLPQQGEFTFEKLQTEDDYRRLLEFDFAELLEAIPSLPKLLLPLPIGRVNRVTAESWAHDSSTLIMGDAAHGMSYFYGMGTNTGLDGTAEFALALAQNGNRLAQAIDQFAESRPPITSLLQDASDRHRDTLLRETLMTERQFRKSLEVELERRFPDRFRYRSSLISFSSIPLREVYDRLEIQDRIIAELLNDDAETLDEIDWAHAESMILARLSLINTVEPVSQDDANAYLAAAVFEALGDLRSGASTYDIARLSRSNAITKIEGFIQKGEPIQFVLTGFPAKSPNSVEKVTGQSVDLGEKIAMARIIDAISRVKRIYPKGVRFIIASDGRSSVSNYLIDDEAVDIYHAGFDRLSLPREIEWYSLDDRYSGMTYDEMREAFFTDYVPTELEVRLSFETDQSRLARYNGLCRFLTGDLTPAERDELQTRNKCKAEGKRRAIDMFRRTDGFAKLIDEQFPGAVRLSIQPRITNPERVGVSLLMGSVPGPSPWHGTVIVFEDGSYKVTTRIEAEEEGWTPVYVNGLLHHFHETGVDHSLRIGNRTFSFPDRNPDRLVAQPDYSFPWIRKAITSLHRGVTEAKYVYEGEGASRFFNSTANTEYRLRDREHRIFENLFPRLDWPEASSGVEMVDIGPGDAQKGIHIAELLEANGISTNLYIPIDSSAAVLEIADEAWNLARPQTDSTPIEQDFDEGIPELSKNAKLTMLVGQTLGNITHRLQLLKEIAGKLGPDDRFVLGVELYKPSKIDETLVGYATEDNLEIHYGLFEQMGIQRDWVRPEVSFNTGTNNIQIRFVVVEEFEAEGLVFRRGHWFQAFSHRFTQEEVIQLLEDAGLDVLDFEIDENAETIVAIAKKSVEE